MPTSIQIADRAGVRTLAMHRPEVHNAFDDALIAELTAAIEAAGHDPAVRAIVLTGDGASFSAGADLNWMRGMAQASEAENRDDSLRLARLMRSLQFCPKPTLARVNGAAYGGGVGLVACCDIAVATQEASFSFSEVKLGLIPAVISPYVIAAIGERHARRYFITGERFDAGQAWRMGLVHELAMDEADMDQRLGVIVTALLTAGPVAIREAKELVRAVANKPVMSELIQDTAERIARVRSSPEGREGVSAFLEKRKPSWIPREPEPEQEPPAA